MSTPILSAYTTLTGVVEPSDLGRNLLRGTRFLSLTDITEGGINLRRINSYDASKVSIADGIDGNRAVKVITTSGETDMYRGVFFKAKVEADTDYTVSAWVRGTSAVAMQIENIDSDGTTRGKYYDNVQQLLSSGWQRITKTIHTHTVSAGYKGYVEVNFYTNSEGYFYISEPKMERGTEATAYTVNEADLVGEAGAPATIYTIEPSADFNTGGTLSEDGKTVTVAVSGSYSVYKITGSAKALVTDTLYGRLTIGTLTSDATITGGKGSAAFSKDYSVADKASIPTSCLLTVYSDAARTKAVASQVLSVSLNPNAIFDVNTQLGEITLMTTSQRSAANMWVDGDFILPASIAPAYIHNATTGATERIDDVDLPAGFIRRLVFNVPVANGGVYYKGTQPHITTSTIAGSDGKTKNGYILSFFAKATKGCEMTAGLEGSVTGTVHLTGSWQRFQINIPQASDLSKWTGAIIFYPTTAIGTDQYVCLTGIQFEQGTGQASVWTKSEYDIERAGLRIGNGGIEAIAGKFDFVGKDGNPYIRCEQDENGYPHFVFYIPGTEYPAYDLGSTGLSQIVESSTKLTFPLVKLSGDVKDMQGKEVSGNFYIGKIKWKETDTDYSEVDVWNLSYDYYKTIFLGMYEFHPAHFKNKAGTTIYVPTNAKNYENRLYWSQNISDGLPIGTPVEDGWYLLVYSVYSHTKRRSVSYTSDGMALVNMGEMTYNEVCYLAIGISGGKIISDRISFSVQTGSISGNPLRDWPIKDTANNVGLSFSFLDDSEDSSMISYDSANGVLKFYQPVIK